MQQDRYRAQSVPVATSAPAPQILPRMQLVRQELTRLLVRQLAQLALLGSTVPVLSEFLVQLYLCLYEIFSIQKCGFLFTLVSLFCTSLVAFWMISVELFGCFVVRCCDGCGCFVCFLHFFLLFCSLYSQNPFTPTLILLLF